MRISAGYRVGFGGRFGNRTPYSKVRGNNRKTAEIYEKIYP